MLTNCTITDKDGKVTDYVWDDQKKAMVEGKIEQEIPWWQLHEIAKSLGGKLTHICLLYTSPSPRDATLSRMPSSA